MKTGAAIALAAVALLALIGGVLLLAPGPAPVVVGHPPVEQARPGDGFVTHGDIAERSSRRAFYSAPPVIPHRLGERRSECLACHQEGREFQGRVAPRTPHPELVNCVQCHVKATPPPVHEDLDTAVDSTWVGLAEPTEGSRHHAFAPPTIPHRQAMRENCTACHNTAAPNQALRCAHAERANCMQCHVPDAGAEFRAFIGR